MSAAISQVVPPVAGAKPHPIVQTFHRLRRWLKHGRNDRRVVAKAVADVPAASPYHTPVTALYAAIGDFVVETPTCPSSTVEWSAMLRRARSAGFQLLGSGHFAAVFAHANYPDIAFKFGFKKEDSGATYAAWARDNQDLVGVPIIHYMTRRAAGYCVVMKRYQALSEAVDLDRVFACHAALMWVIEDGASMTSEFTCWRGLIRRGVICDFISADLYYTAAEIRSFFSEVAFLDLHDENVMLDPDTQQLVITDPVSFARTGGAT